MVAEHIEHMRCSGLHFLLPIDEERCLCVEESIRWHVERVRAGSADTAADADAGKTKKATAKSPDCSKLRTEICKTTSFMAAEDWYLSSLLKQRHHHHNCTFSPVHLLAATKLLQTLQNNNGEDSSSYNTGFESKELRMKIKGYIRWLEECVVVIAAAATVAATSTGNFTKYGGDNDEQQGQRQLPPTAATAEIVIINPVDIRYCEFDIECARLLEDLGRCVGRVLKEVDKEMKMKRRKNHRREQQQLNREDKEKEEENGKEQNKKEKQQQEEEGNNNNNQQDDNDQNNNNTDNYHRHHQSSNSTINSDEDEDSITTIKENLQKLKDEIEKHRNLHFQHGNPECSTEDLKAMSEEVEMLSRRVMMMRRRRRRGSRSGGDDAWVVNVGKGRTTLGLSICE